jgi:hypothetical protein
MRLSIGLAGIGAPLRYLNRDDSDQWQVSPNLHFGGRAPIELIRDGKLDRVEEEAKALTSG